MVVHRFTQCMPGLDWDDEVEVAYVGGYVMQRCLTDIPAAREGWTLEYRCYPPGWDRPFDRGTPNPLLPPPDTILVMAREVRTCEVRGCSNEARHKVDFEYTRSRFEPDTTLSPGDHYQSGTYRTHSYPLRVWMCKAHAV